MFSRRVTNVPAKHKTRCRNLYDRYSNADEKKNVSTDEKDFTLEIVVNRQNDIVYGSRKKSSRQIAFIMNPAAFQKRPWFLLVSAGVVKLTSTALIRKLHKLTRVLNELPNEGLLPDCRRMYPNEYDVFQQHRACHISAVPIRAI